MAISHLCTTCGADLARVRARREPYYGLPLVVCPHCGTPAVRRRHPLQKRWRSGRQLALSLTIIQAQLLLLIGFVVLTTVVCVQFGDDFSDRSLNFQQVGTTIIAALSFGLLPVALGTWLTAGLPHWRRAMPWIAFTLLILPMLSIDTLLLPSLTHLMPASGMTGEVGSCRWDLWLGRLAALAAILAVAVLGIPIGKGLTLAHDHARHALKRARLRRRRVRRAIA